MLNVVHCGPGLKKTDAENERTLSFTLITPTSSEGTSDPYVYSKQFYFHTLFETLYIDNNEDEQLSSSDQRLVHEMNKLWTLQQFLPLNSTVFKTYYTEKKLHKITNKETKKTINWWIQWKVAKTLKEIPDDQDDQDISNQSDLDDQDDQD